MCQECGAFVKGLRNKGPNIWVWPTDPFSTSLLMGSRIVVEGGHPLFGLQGAS